MEAEAVPSEVTIVRAGTVQPGGITLAGDYAGECLWYLYHAPDRRTVAFSRSLNALLASPRVVKPLRVSSHALSGLLQCGVVPSPQTIYSDVYLLGIGDSVDIVAERDKVRLLFSYEFPFLSHLRGERQVDRPFEQDLLEALSAASLGQVRGDALTILFQSAGKDSNAIALALAEAGAQDQIQSVTYSAPGDRNEADIAGAIATRLGFAHQSIPLPEALEPEHEAAFDQFFRESPLPSTDLAALAYPLVAAAFGTRTLNVIDGAGNDVYFGSVPRRHELRRQRYWQLGSRVAPLFEALASESRIHQLKKCRAEYCGMSGFSKRDLFRIYSEAVDSREYWIKRSRECRTWDYLDFRASILGGTIAQEVFARKVRNAADAFAWRAIFPWMNERVARLVFSVCREQCFDAVSLRNKVFLRALLRDRLGLDSDKLGKLSYAFDHAHVLNLLGPLVMDEILNCPYWQRDRVKAVVMRLRSHASGSGRRQGELSGVLLHRLYMISAWLNRNRYLKGERAG